MKRLFSLLFILVPALVWAQETDLPQEKIEQAENHIIKGRVLNDADDKEMSNVHIINLNQVIGTISGEHGEFEIRAAVNDTLYFSYLGFKSIRVRVTNDWLKYGDIKVKMTELSIALEEVELHNVQLTGYLELDAKIIPVYDNYQYRIAGLSGKGYEGGSNRGSGVSKVLNSVFNPADFLYNMFGKRPTQMRKLRKMKEQDHIRNLLQDKFDREALMMVLQIEKSEVDEILRSCNFSENFMESSSDLQVLDAISECYEKYRVIKK